MIVWFSVIFWGCLGFVIPRKYMRIYMILAAVGLSSLYFFFQPPVRYDLYRHYEMMHLIRKYDLWTVMSGALNNKNRVLESIQQGSPVYLFYTYLISRLQIDQLLPVLTGIVIYVSTSSIILMAADDIDENIADWKISFCFFFLLAMLDFRTISGLRNMTSYALFAYVLYKDLVRKANKPLCFIAYLVIANIHTSIYILIFIRLLIVLNRLIPKVVLVIGLLAAYSSVDLILHYLERYAYIPMIQALIIKMYIYGFGGGSRYIIYKGVLRFIFMVIYLLLYLYCRKKIPQTERFYKYGDFILLFSMYAFGAVRQYDIFVRSNVFLYFAILPFLLLFLHYIAGETPLQLILPASSMVGFSEASVYFMIFSVMAVSLYVYYGGYYRPMDAGILYGLEYFVF